MEQEAYKFAATELYRASKSIGREGLVMKKLITRCCSFDTVEVGEFFQWGNRNGEVYVKIKVQKYRSLTAHEKKANKHIFDIPAPNRFTYSYAALNVRTYQTNYDISGGNIQCVRLRGNISVEMHGE